MASCMLSSYSPQIYPQLKFQELKRKDSRRFPSLQTNMLSGTCVPVWVKTETDCTSHCPVPMCSLAVYCDPNACVPLLHLRAWMRSQGLDEVVSVGREGTGSSHDLSVTQTSVHPRGQPSLLHRAEIFSLLCWNLFFFFILAENISFLGLTFFLWFLSWGGSKVCFYCSTIDVPDWLSMSGGLGRVRSHCSLTWGICGDGRLAWVCPFPKATLRAGQNTAQDRGCVHDFSQTSVLSKMLNLPGLSSPSSKWGNWTWSLPTACGALGGALKSCLGGHGSHRPIPVLSPGPSLTFNDRSNSA